MRRIALNGEGMDILVICATGRVPLPTRQILLAITNRTLFLRSREASYLDHSSDGPYLSQRFRGTEPPILICFPSLHTSGSRFVFLDAEPPELWTRVIVLVP